LPTGLPTNALAGIRRALPAKLSVALYAIRLSVQCAAEQNESMKKSIDFGLDDHPDGNELAGTAWAVAITDDCEYCDDLRVEVTVEERGAHGTGVVAHLSPRSTRRLQAALSAALKELGA
jgi:hypothetical protein